MTSPTNTHVGQDSAKGALCIKSAVLTGRPAASPYVVTGLQATDTILEFTLLATTAAAPFISATDKSASVTLAAGQLTCTRDCSPKPILFKWLDNTD